ncbi:branched-chain amino acid aminotransferase [Cyclobacteriaceae bacterium YHN15]|jgi:branched-chain amino acid aminotransferase|nr:branched-chain amino acid aminotransferase [Cyclobacteriaceae bacterium YHN15]
MKTFCFANSRIIESDKAQIHPMDIGLIRGYGIFDFFRTSNYCPLFLNDYLDRFIRSAEKTHLNLTFNKAELSQIIHELVEKNDLKNGGIRMLLSGGVSENHFSPTKSSFFIFCEDLEFPSEGKYEKGVKLLALEHIRSIADIKTTNYTFPVWHSNIWKKEGAEDVLYHMNGEISESSRSNIFIVKEGKISTPSKNILHGITRKRLLELAPDTEVRNITLQEVLDSDEVFMSSTTKKVLPVTQIDNRIIGNGSPGPIVKKLLEGFAEMEQKISV